MKKTLCLTVVFLSVAAAVAAQPADPASKGPGRYIVVFNDNVRDVPGLARGLANRHGAEPIFVYEHALKGFAVALPEQAAVALSRNPNVAYVEPDSRVWAFGDQPNPTWGLDRIDQASPTLDHNYHYDSTGIGVTAYIIDTGILVGHSQFGGRASSGYDFVDNDANATDCNGHGTHVAGTVGGATYGVAKQVSLVAVRVLGCDGSGSTTGVIAGIDWVTAHHVGPSVANMSLGGGASSALDAAVRASIASGVAYALSAGNGNRAGVAQDACNYSPARVAEAMTISATDSADRKASWANYGSCVDWFAPGVGITSAWYTGTSATGTISGTSMATPHTTGVAALYLADHRTATPAEVREAIYAATTKGIVTNSKTANNHLLYSLLGSTPPPDNQAPVAAFTFTVSGLTAAFTDASNDPDGSIAGWSWSFGDGGTSTAQSPSHTYASAGTYTVTLTVTDNDGAIDSVSRDVTVSTAAGITLTATGRKSGAKYYADLRWTGATGASIDVFRDTARITTTANDGLYSNALGKAVSPSYTYRVCEAGSTVCSNEVTVRF